MHGWRIASRERLSLGTWRNPDVFKSPYSSMGALVGWTLDPPLSWDSKWMKMQKTKDSQDGSNGKSDPAKDNDYEN